MKYSLAITCLLVPSSEAIKLRNLAMNHAKWPTFPSGDNITKVVAKAMEMGRREVKDALSSSREDCWTPTNWDDAT